MTELIKRLRVTGNGLSAEWLEYDVPEATNRAEELEAKLTECEARLSKAVEALREIKSVECVHCTDYFHELADAVLTDLEGKE